MNYQCRPKLKLIRAKNFLCCQAEFKIMEQDNSILFSKIPRDFTKPNIIKAGKYCVRNFEVRNSIPTTSDQLPPYIEEDKLVSCTEVDDSYDIIVNNSGKFLLKFPLSSSYYGNIIGSKGSIRRQIESDTHTVIRIPKIGDENNIIRISGENERSVVTAKNRIDIIVRQVKDKHQITHFISIPVISDAIKHNLEVFRENLLKGTLIRGLDVSMFQNPNKLHLTIATLVLIDEIEEEEAVRVLEKCKDEVIGPSFKTMASIQIGINGVEIMNDDPTNVDVLYGIVKIEPPKYADHFQNLADGIVNYFANKGIIRKQYEKVKLHVTLINSSFRKTNNENPKQKREPFDATRILQEYKKFTFGFANIASIHLSVRFTTSENKYYDALTTVNIKSS